MKVTLYAKSDRITQAAEIAMKHIAAGVDDPKVLSRASYTTEDGVRFEAWGCHMAVKVREADANG